ncbi:MAG: hypothetical protein EZS28_040863 [Streblomastix strix]|uniref:Cyclin N-terminal domain-containing protein n=1 Tax=Streblomastix strix TaxID=222440 RepID=A0A5J4U0W0_9EUKA|nr:MAG: hypothetical protein EZS28_040863 [Streblomastix strix]
MNFEQKGIYSPIIEIKRKTEESENFFRLIAQKLLSIVIVQIPDISLNISVDSLTLFLNFLRDSVCLSVEEGIIAIALLQRFARKQQEKGIYILNTKNVGTLLVVLAIVTMKMNRDHVHRNSSIGRMFNIPVRILNESEMAFLNQIDHEALVEEDTFSLLLEEILHIQAIGIQL